MRVRQAVISDLSIRKYIFNSNQVFKLKILKPLFKQKRVQNQWYINPN